MDPLAFPNRQDSNRRDTIKDCAIEDKEAPIITSPSIQTLIEEFKSVDSRRTSEKYLRTKSTFASKSNEKIDIGKSFQD